MTKRFKYDRIGYWSEVKLAIIREYAAAYSQILAAQPEIRRHVYIDAFADEERAGRGCLLSFLEITAIL